MLLLQCCCLGSSVMLSSFFSRIDIRCQRLAGDDDDAVDALHTRAAAESTSRCRGQTGDAVGALRTRAAVESTSRCRGRAGDDDDAVDALHTRATALRQCSWSSAGNIF